MNIEVLYTEGCSHTPLAIERIQNIANAEKYSYELVQINVDSFEKASELNFLGSPTIRVNGVDIDPFAKHGKFEGFT